jgi:hypothetical protein
MTKYRIRDDPEPDLWNAGEGTFTAQSSWRQQAVDDDE